MLANEMNKSAHLSKQQQYDFYRNLVRPRKRYSKWTKPEVDEKVDVVAKYYKMSKIKAREMTNLLSDEAIQKMKEYIDPGGKI
jgi:flavorubredoxin